MDSIVARYRQLFIETVGMPNPNRGESDLPVPWFARNIWRRLQWSAYVGECQGPKGLGFGLNLEFLPEWRAVRRRLTTENMRNRLEGLHHYEWHWQGRPGFLIKNPPVYPLAAHQLVQEIDINAWLHELDEILRGEKKCPNDWKMRPQLQIMQRVGNARIDENMRTVEDRIRQIITDMQPLITLFRGW